MLVLVLALVGDLKKISRQTTALHRLAFCLQASCVSCGQFSHNPDFLPLVRPLLLPVDSHAKSTDRGMAEISSSQRSPERPPLQSTWLVGLRIHRRQQSTTAATSNPASTATAATATSSSSTTTTTATPLATSTATPSSSSRAISPDQLASLDRAVEQSQRLKADFCAIAFDASDHLLRQALVEKYPPPPPPSPSSLFYDYLTVDSLAGSQGSPSVAETTQILLLPVCPWNAYVPALNAILTVASQFHVDHLLYHSLEVTITPEQVQSMRRRLLEHEGVLVVGRGFHDAHQSPHAPLSHGKMERNPLNGLTSPWNTCAFWKVDRLARTGFLTVSDGLVAGMTTTIIAIAIARK